MAFQLYTLAFDPGGSIPLRFTGDGADVSPSFSWVDVPEGTQSFALVCVDPDAPRGDFYHWVILDLPAELRSLSERVPAREAVAGGRHGLNDFGRLGYGGPMPPPRHGQHRYYFRLFALSVPRLDVSALPKGPEVERKARGLALAMAEVMGVYER